MYVVGSDGPRLVSRRLYVVGLNNKTVEWKRRRDYTCSAVYNNRRKTSHNGHDETRREYTGEILTFGKALGLSCLLQLAPLCVESQYLPGFLHKATDAAALMQTENSVIHVFEQNQQSVVYITNLAYRRDAFTMNQLEIPQGAGSGIVWDDTLLILFKHMND